MIAEEDSGWRIILLEKKSGELKVVAKAEHLDFPSLRKMLDENPSVPVVPGIRGGFVFEKIVPAAEPSALVASILGVNVENPKDFPVMAFPAANGKVLASVIRKDKLDEMLQIPGFPADRVMDCCFSEACMVLALLHTEPFSSQSFHLKTTNRDYYFSKGQWLEDAGAASFVEASADDIARIFEVSTDDAFLVSAGLYAMLRNPAEPAAYSAVEKTRRDFFTVSLMKNIATVAAIFLLCVSLSLVATRTWAESDKAELQSWVSANRGIKDSLNHTRMKLQARMEVRRQLGDKTLRSSKASFYGDRLASVVPKGIRLQKMILWPAAEDLKMAGIKEPSAQEFDMVLMGQAGESKPVSELSSAIEKLDWVREVKVVSSDLNYRSGGYDFVFVLRFRHAG